jgi:hypothetical protein
MHYEDQHDDWLTVEDCAVRLGISQQRVRELVEQRVLRSCYDGGWLMVQPALIAGVTTRVRCRT